MDESMKKALTDLSDKVEKKGASVPTAAAKPAEPAKKEDRKAVAGKPRIDKASNATIIWDKLTAILPPVSSWLSVVVGLAITALSAACLFPAMKTFAEGITLAPEILFILAGIALIAAGILLMRKQKGKGAMAFAVAALVLFAVALGFVVALEAGSVNASAKGAFIAAGVVGIVVSLVFVIAADLAFNIGLTRYFREMFGELKKLTWLSGKELFSHTLAVLVFVLGMAILIAILDWIFGTGFSAISKIKLG